MFKRLSRLIHSLLSKPAQEAPALPETPPLPASPEAGAETAERSKRKRRPRNRKRNKPAAEQQPAWDVSEYQVPPEEGKTRFHDFDLPPELMHGIADLGFSYCTPIQSQVLPHTLQGQDAIGQAQTGTGKTAAFLVALITRLLRKPIGEQRATGTPRALILAPTRELVLQIAEEAKEIGKYCGLTVTAVYGGMDYTKQQQQLQRDNPDIVVATPGRLLDFEGKQDVKLGKVEILVLDEADRMLDMGFIPDVRRIVYSTPKKHARQTLFFSATFPDDIARLAEQWTRDAVRVEVEREHVAADNVEQIVYITTLKEKYALLHNLIQQQDLQRVIVFANRRDETRRLSERLRAHNIACAMLSGDVPQAKRVRTLEDFRSGKFRVLVATDVAGRGLHVEGVSHVFNYSLPQDPEDYVHRIGRTGRAGLAGISISFACEEDAFQLPDIETFVGHPLDYRHPDETLLTPPPPVKKPRDSGESKGPPPPQGERRGPRRRGPRRGGRGGGHGRKTSS